MKILKSAVKGSAVLLGTQPRPVELPNYATPIPEGRRLIRGIPQGSRFSPFLCALHMGAGDAKLPKDVSESLKSGKSTLARLVDDFLYLCTDPEGCCQFLSCLAQENPYGGDLNLQKCVANFSFRRIETPEPAFVPSGSRSSREVEWAGLTLSPENGFINIRHGTKRRATDGMAVKKSFRGPEVAPWERAIRSKLLVFLKMKLQPLLLDPRLNSDDCVRDNLARVCRFCAWRFVWLLRSRRLPKVKQAFISQQTRRLVRYAIICATNVRASGLSREQFVHLPVLFAYIDLACCYCCCCCCCRCCCCCCCCCCSVFSCVFTKLFTYLDLTTPLLTFQLRTASK